MRNDPRKKLDDSDVKAFESHSKSRIYNKANWMHLNLVEPCLNKNNWVTL